MSEGAVRKIGEVAEATGLSIRTLRHYDELGLVVPSGHTAGGFRLYTDDDVERLLLVRRMKPLGFSLERMKQFLQATDVLAAGRRPQAGESGSEERRAARATVEEIHAEAEARYRDLQTHLAYGAEFLQLVRERLD
ncbi:MerR family transcriptional regulator [Dietzia lutea]|uniref:MerR family transcriptional regulator n=1 Tax=Dietzia lutea TaxID=546160 RepID=A0A2S1RAN6_9ACTN|nr:MerR family transcriptional regulator [Dietzia lutea]AWH93348.1 MerR family transcriptional regulator [Dietzia lutea]